MPTIGDLDALAGVLGGRLIRPNDARYGAAAQLYSPRFDGVRPVAVARCASTDDVQRCLEFVRATGTAVAARSGGHSYAGYSTTSGLVIDVAALNSIGPGRSAGTARIGAGARLADVYAKLADVGSSIPAGSCPTVGITGLALGGGIGVVARMYGLTCDAITAVELVTADGHVLRCDENTAPDLFWAHKGGGGGNFGVVTALEFATYKARQLSYFLVRWNWTHAHDVVAGWQSWLSAAPAEVWASLHIDGAGSASDTPHVYVSGVYVGDAGGLSPVLDSLQDASKAAMTTRFTKQASLLTTMMVEGGCADLSLAQCRPESEGGTLGRESQVARSDYIADPLPASAIDVVLAAIEARKSQKLFGGSALFDAYGGAINQVGATDTAFVHRDELACLQYVAPIFDATALAPNQAWVDGLYASMRPYVSGYAYQNYIDPELADWQHAYYGANLDRLIDVKTRYDPKDVLHFAQGIPTR
jgi:FAD/FMN-containing dehydrogenase